MIKYKQIKYVSNNLLGSYLAGLIEGDGCIIIRKGKLEKISPAVIFTFHNNEKPLFEKIKAILGSGNIYKEKKGNTCRYQITNANAVIKVFNLINGYFRTPKIKFLHMAIDNVNKWRDANIVKLPIDMSDFNTNAWLAGFTDTDGHFSIKLTGYYKSFNSIERDRVQCIFSINQNEIYKKTGESCISFMTKLANFFSCNLNYKNGINTYLIFFVQNDKNQKIVTDYFDKYTLMSSKYLNYLCYVKGLNYLGKRLSEKEIIEIQTIKSLMNNKRTNFDWSHLKNFYA